MYRGVAQFGRALRSGRRGRRFESCRLDFTWPVGQAVKTKASHALNPGSIPGRVTKKQLTERLAAFFFASKNAK